MYRTGASDRTRATPASGASATEVIMAAVAMARSPKPPK